MANTLVIGHEGRRLERVGSAHGGTRCQDEGQEHARCCAEGVCGAAAARRGARGAAWVPLQCEHRGARTHTEKKNEVTRSQFRIEGQGKKEGKWVKKVCGTTLCQ